MSIHYVHDSKLVTGNKIKKLSNLKKLFKNYNESIDIQKDLCAVHFCSRIHAITTSLVQTILLSCLKID